MKLKICFEIDELAIDENGNPAPAGMCVAFDIEDGTKLPDYQELTQSIKKDGVLRMAGLDGFVNVENMRFITPEEYEREYGDNEQEG